MPDGWVVLENSLTFKSLMVISVRFGFYNSLNLIDFFLSFIVDSYGLRH